MREAGIASEWVSRVGDCAGLENEDDDVAVARRRLRGRASGSRAAGTRVLDEDDDARRFVEDGLMASDKSGMGLLAGRSRTSGRCDGDCVERGASELSVGVIAMVACRVVVVEGGLVMSCVAPRLGLDCVASRAQINTIYCR